MWYTICAMVTKEQVMPKAHIEGGELRIPLTDDIREKLDVHEGDELEAHVFSGSVLLRPASPSVDAPERAWQSILEITDQVQPTPEQAAKPIEQVEQEIVDWVKE